jgi:hypothetical protein
MELNFIASVMTRSMCLGSVERMDVCCVAECAAPRWYYALPRLTYPHVLDRYVAGTPSTWCQSNGLSAWHRPYLTHRDCCILPASSVPGRPWPAEGNCRYVRGREVHRLDVMSRQHPADAIEYRLDTRQQICWSRLKFGVYFISLRSNLHIVLASNWGNPWKNTDRTRLTTLTLNFI